MLRSWRSAVGVKWTATTRAMVRLRRSSSRGVAGVGEPRAVDARGIFGQRCARGHQLNLGGGGHLAAPGPATANVPARVSSAAL